MNLIRATGYLLRVAPKPRFALSKRGAQFLDEDWKPGAYPRTEAERLAAAKKYNMLPEEYEPYDPEKWEISAGDYPHLPNRCWGDEDPYHAWDNWASRRNFEQPVHFFQCLYEWYLPDLRKDNHYDPFHPIMCLLGAYVLTYIGCLLGDKYERITLYKPIHRVDRPWETYYHYPNSKIEYYD